MYSETHPIFFSTMSSSSDKLFLVRKDQQDTGNSQGAERPIFEFQSESTASNSSSETHCRGAQEEKKEEEEGESCENRIEPKEEKLKVEQEEEEEDDGFRTPTSLDHRIPEAKQCPSAPRKPKPSLKRKANDSHSSFTSPCRGNPLDLSREVELLLFPTQHNPLSDSHQNRKKSRRQECK